MSGFLTTEDTEGTEGATPETDAKASPHIGFYSCETVPANLAQKLERERDEARGAIIGWENKWKCAVEMAARAEVERDELRDFADELVDLVAYGLGQNGSFWSQVAMRKAREAITKAKALEARP